ncbi:MAG: rod shape-determining protein MreD [Gammaproteobacteria bacterium]|nr:rod shape-determining protein MreD [Gammaproteobacteria bacterium]
MEAVADSRASGLWVIAGTFMVAMILAIVPIPDNAPLQIAYLRPEWIVLVMIYWGIALPHRVGVMVACFVGLFTDVLLGSLLGQHAIGYIVVAYLAASFYQRLRMFSVWQQSLVVFATVGLNQLINFWIESIAGLTEWNTWYLLASVMSALLWPWVFLLLRYLRRRFNVS